MPGSTRTRWTAVTAGVLLALVVLAVVALGIAQREIRARVIAVLGPLGSAQSMDVGFTSVQLNEVVLKAPPGWPAPDALRAKRITLVFDVRDALAHRLHLRAVAVSGFEMSVVREANGSLHILPNLRQSLGRPAGGAAAASGSAAAPSEKRIDHIDFHHGQFDFYDLTLGKTPYRIRITQADAQVDDLRLPALDTQTKIAAHGVIPGPAHTGSVSFDGWIRLANKDSQTTTTLQGIDVSILSPYLFRKTSAQPLAAHGTADLKVDSTVRDGELHAPGTLTLHHLQLVGTGNPVDTFLSIPTRAAVAALKSHDGDVTVHFVLAGNLHDPSFSLNENLLAKIGNGFAQAMGMSVEGVAKGAGETVKGIGNALKNLLGQ
jgi:hypothetical protein